MTKKTEKLMLLEEEGLTLREQFIEAEKAVNKVSIKQADMIRALLLAIIAKEHALLVGPHGCNKTRAINGLLTTLNANHNGDTFFATLDKSTPPEVLLGMPSVKALQEEDRWRRNTKGKLPEAKFAFIGEVFRASAMTRASLHTVINERYIENDGERVDCPLHTLFADSNSYPVREEDFPFYDRLLVRYNVNYIPGSDKDAFIAMLTADEAEPVTPVVDLGGIEQAYQETLEIEFTKPVAAILQEIRARLLEKEIVLSNRRWARSKNILRASAWLRGDTKVDSPDITVLRYVLWDTPEQYEVLKEILADYAIQNAVITEEEILKEAERIYSTAVNSDSLDIGSAIISLAEMQENISNETKQQLSVWIDDLNHRLINDVMNS